jgi:membrane associated rhomboid family serine protease
MGLYDRDYTQDDSREQSQYTGMPQMRFGLPKLTQVVKWLIIANFVVFLTGLFLPNNILIPNGSPNNKVNFFDFWFSVLPYSFAAGLQLWRLFTYQFLHGDLMHIFFNMLALFFLGPALETHWGQRKFLTFYLACGAAGGLFYTFLVAVGFLPALPMIGASGSILGLLAACAILFPNFVVFVFLFPVPIRLAAIGFAVMFLVSVLTKGPNAGGEAAHLAGMFAGVAYCLSAPLFTKATLILKASHWKKTLASEQKLQAELDRILQKVHDEGLHSLSSKEKRTLRKATHLEQSKKPPF